MSHSNVERALDSFLQYRDVHDKYKQEKATPGDVNAVLRAISGELCTLLSAEDICTHMKFCGAENAREAYGSDPDTALVHPSLLPFMHYVPGNAVLDLGCGGALRDTLFLSCRDLSSRAKLMGQEKDDPLSLRPKIPSRVFDVLAVDGAPRVLELAQVACNAAVARWFESGMQSGKDFHPPRLMLSDMHDLSGIKDKFAGIWSSNALFSHTPATLINPALRSVATRLFPAGIFAVRYPWGGAGKSYDSFRLMQKRQVEYISRPDPDYIANQAYALGLRLRITHKKPDDPYITQIYQYK